MPDRCSMGGAALMLAQRAATLMRTTINRLLVWDAMETAQPATGDTGAAPDVSRKIDYLALNREFTAGVMGPAVSALTPERDGPWRVLDAGTGTGGALPELIELARGSGGSVLAVDLDADAAEVARTLTVTLDAGDLAEVRVADLREVVREARASGELFDVIWAADVVWPAAFGDPDAVVAELAGALAPGGVLGLFTANYYQSMFLPGHSRIERLIRTASELTWGIPSDGPAHYERLGAWMRQAGLEDVRLRVLPVAGPMTDPVVRGYVEQIVWPEMRHAVAARGRAAGMSDDDVARAGELLDPGSPTYAGRDPDGYAVAPMLLWTGTAARRA